MLMGWVWVESLRCRLRDIEKERAIFRDLNHHLGVGVYVSD
jgi:hypothetical protein